MKRNLLAAFLLNICLKHVENRVIVKLKLKVAVRMKKVQQNSKGKNVISIVITMARKK